MEDDNSQPKDENEIYTAAVNKWGQDFQLDLLIEELVEAIGAVIDFKDPGNMERFKKGADKVQRRFGKIDGLQGIFDAIGMTIAQYVKMQSQQLKTVMKMVRKDGLSIYNEPFDMGVMVSAGMQGIMNKMDDEEEDEIDPREHLAEELADVEIMIAQARFGMGLGELIDKHKRAKVARLQKRLESEG